MAHHEPSCSNQTECDADGCADAMATVALMALVVGAVVYWLSGMPM